MYCVASGALKVYMYDRILALFSSVEYQPPTSDDTIGIDLAAHLTNTSLQTETGEKYVRLLDELVGTSILSEFDDDLKTVTKEDLDDILYLDPLLVNDQKPTKTMYTDIWALGWIMYEVS